MVCHTESHSTDNTVSTPLQKTQNNMCSSGSSHAILHMATFKGFFFHAGFNLICCRGIEEAEHSIEPYTVDHGCKDGWMDTQSDRRSSSVILARVSSYYCFVFKRTLFFFNKKIKSQVNGCILSYAFVSST